jgi:serine/threonine protein kinase
VPNALDTPQITSQPATPDRLAPGFVLDERFEIISFVGQGGMSVVYKARQLQMDRLVAIKLLQRHLHDDDEAVQRFQREAKAVSVLEHPNIVQVYGFGCVDGLLYMAVEFLQGKSLGELLKDEQRLAPERALPIFRQICDALVHAHERGVVHRDLKPSNVMLVGEPWQVKLVDFGIAKILPESGKDVQQLTRTGSLIGTALYMSPEQCGNQPADARSDIYSMGCLMYEILTGKPPFEGNTPYEVMSKHLTETVPPSSYLRDDLAQIVMAAMEKDRTRRIQSAVELKEALRSPAEFERKLPSGKKRSARYKAKLPTLKLLIGAALVGAMVLVATAFLGMTRPTKGHDDRNSPASPHASAETTNCRYWLCKGNDAMERMAFDEAEKCWRKTLQLAQDRSQNGNDAAGLRPSELAHVKSGLATALGNEANGPPELRRRIGPEGLRLTEEVISALKVDANKQYNVDYEQALYNRATFFAFVNDQPAALKVGEEDFQYQERMSHDPRTVARSAARLASMYRSDGQLVKALSLSEKALSLMEMTSHRDGDDGYVYDLGDMRWGLSATLLQLSKQKGDAGARKRGLAVLHQLENTEWPDDNNNPSLHRQAANMKSGVKQLWAAYSSSK